jgi:CDP-paratose 2-epimerase
MNNIQAVSGRTFNVGGGNFSSASLQELTTLCRDITGNTIPIRSVTENRPADLRIYISDNTRIETASGWSPTTPIGDSLQEIFEWIRKDERILKPILDK